MAEPLDQESDTKVDEGYGDEGESVRSGSGGAADVECSGGMLLSLVHTPASSLSGVEISISRQER